MASKKSSQNPYRWPDGSWHSRPVKSAGGSFGGGGVVPNKGSYGGGNVGPGAAGLVPRATPMVGGQPNQGLGPVGGPPIDPQYEAYKLSSGRNLAIGNADATYQRGQLEQSYGYGASGAANPYSRAALLEESFKRSKLGTTNSYASSGQLYSGAYGRMQGENERQYSIGADQNRREYDQAVYGVNRGQAQNAANYGVGMDDEKFKALLRSLGVG